MNAQFKYPAKRITVNLAPADLPKEGGRFDLPIAIGILAASDQLDGSRLKQFEFVGELALTGELRGVHGVIPAILAAQKANEPPLSLIKMPMKLHLFQNKRLISLKIFWKSCNS